MKPAILLLHGALGSRDQFIGLQDALEQDFDVHRINFRGHGGRILPEHYRLDDFIEDVLFYIQAEKLQKVYLFGFSMGGFVGLAFMKKYPDKILGLITLGTKWHWDAEVAAKETKMLDPLKIKEKVPAYADYLAKLHRPNSWEEVLWRTKHFMTQLGSQKQFHVQGLNALNHPVYIFRGDLDQMVSDEEGQYICSQLSNGHYEVLPTIAHPIEKVDVNFLAELIKDQFIA